MLSPPTTMLPTAVSLALLASRALAFSASAKTNVAIYWGQGPYQARLVETCKNPNVDIINVAFVNVFPDQGPGEYPGTNFGNACDGTTYDHNGVSTDLLKGCKYIGPDITTCQKTYGKKILLSLGGGYPLNYYIANDSSAVNFADFLWGAFGPVTNAWTNASKPRPFGSAVVDGFDFDIESEIDPAPMQNGATISNYKTRGYVKMISTFKQILFPRDSSKKYFISGAPQCVVPDAHLGTVVTNAWFDFLFVQFYNTPACSARAGIEHINGRTSNDISFDKWTNVNFHNPNVKVYIGLPAAKNASNSDSYYLPPANAYILIKKFYGNAKFGGVMLWEATYGANNVICGKNYPTWIKEILTAIKSKTKLNTVTNSCNDSQPNCGTCPPLHKSTTGRCGPNYGLTCIGSGYGGCCGPEGYCSGNSSICAASTCDSSFSKCTSSKDANLVSPANQATNKPVSTQVTGRMGYKQVVVKTKRAAAELPPPTSSDITPTSVGLTILTSSTPVTTPAPASSESSVASTETTPVVSPIVALIPPSSSPTVLALSSSPPAASSPTSSPSFALIAAPSSPLALILSSSSPAEIPSTPSSSIMSMTTAANPPSSLPSIGNPQALFAIATSTTSASSASATTSATIASSASTAMTATSVSTGNASIDLGVVNSTSPSSVASTAAITSAPYAAKAIVNGTRNMNAIQYLTATITDVVYESITTCAPTVADCSAHPESQTVTYVTQTVSIFTTIYISGSPAPEPTTITSNLYTTINVLHAPTGAVAVDANLYNPHADDEGTTTTTLSNTLTETIYHTSTIRASRSTTTLTSTLTVYPIGSDVASAEVATDDSSDGISNDAGSNSDTSRTSNDGGSASGSQNNVQNVKVNAKISPPKTYGNSNSSGVGVALSKTNLTGLNIVAAHKIHMPVNDEKSSAATRSWYRSSRSSSSMALILILSSLLGIVL